METHFENPPPEQDVENKTLNEVGDPQQAEFPNVAVSLEPVRSVNFILDPSAFTLGLGNIERWFDQAYFRSQVKNKKENIHLNLYLPTYTLHELDYQRRGPIVGSSKAQEALKFMDRVLENEDDGISGYFDDIGECSSVPKKHDSRYGHFLHNLFLEHRTHQFPPWSACAKFQLRDPNSQELRHHGKYSLYDEINHVGGGNSEYTSDEELAPPVRLKHLIRSGIYLTRMKHNGPPLISGDMWKLVTEDTVTKVWASCFGIDCLNINEAELLLFHDKDLMKFEIKNEGADFFSEQDIYQPEAPDSLHKKVNTTSYKYTDLKAMENAKNTKRVGDRRRAHKNSGPEDSSGAGVRVEGGVLTEEFRMINFAPREEKTKLVVSKLFSNKAWSTNLARKASRSKTLQAKGAGKSKESESTKSTSTQHVSTDEKPSEKKTVAINAKSRRKRKLHKAKDSADGEKLTAEFDPVEKPKQTPKAASSKKPTKKKPSAPRKSPAKDGPVV